MQDITDLSIPRDLRSEEREAENAILATPKSQQRPEVGFTGWLCLAVELLRAAKCPECDGSGAIPVPLGENFVSHEMAMDAVEPSMEGQSMGIEWGAQQCQWCDERSQFLARYNAAGELPPPGKKL